VTNKDCSTLQTLSYTTMHLSAAKMFGGIKHLRRGGMFKDCFIANLLLSVPVKEFKNLENR